MHLLANENEKLQQALAGASEKFNYTQRGIAIAALIVALVSFGFSIFSLGLSQGWW